MKFAAIDIGSNVVRLLLARVIEDGNPPVGWAKIEQIYVPEIGLADGLISYLVREL